MNKIPCEYSKKSPHLLPAGFSGVPARSFWKTKRSRKRILAKRNKYAILSAVHTADSFLRKGFYDLAYCGADRCGGRHRADGDGFRRGRRFDAGAAAFVWCGHGVRRIDVHLYCADSFACVEIPPQNGLSVYRIADRRFFTVQRRDDQSDQVAGSAVDRSRLRRVSAGAFPLLSVQYRRS